jgi:hypothetical protein
MVGSKVVNACQDKARPHFGPGIIEHPYTVNIHQGRACRIPPMEFVIAKDCPDTQRREKAVQDLKQFLLWLAVSFENVSEQDHNVRAFSLYLGNTRIQPLLAEQRSDVQVGHGNENCTIHLMGQSREPHLVFLHHRRP